MSWKYFFEFLLELAFAFALGALLGMGICVLAACLDDAWLALWRWWKGKNTSPQPSPQRGEGGDDHDLDGGVGGAPVCP